MKTVNNEEQILEYFKMTTCQETLLLGNVLHCSKIRSSLINPFRYKHWINSSAKNAPPPDFYNDKLKLMMDVMRIDDNAYVDERGKVQNPIYRRENELLRKYFGNDYKSVRNDISCYVVASSGLPTQQDHNFSRYIENFKRVFNGHNLKIENYKKNHPGYQTIFFIFDESTAYFQAEDKKYIREQPQAGKISRGIPHIPCCDERFLNIIKDSQVDYVIWFMPYKLIRQSNGRAIPLPKCAIIERTKIPKKVFQTYNSDLIVSAEE